MSCMPGDFQLPEHREPKDIYTALYNHLRDYEQFDYDTTRRLIDELEDSLHYYYDNQSMNSMAVGKPADVYRSEIWTSIRQVQMASKGLKAKVEFGCAVWQVYADCALMLPGKESCKINQLVSGMRSGADNMLTRCGAIFISPTKSRLRKISDTIVMGLGEKPRMMIKHMYERSFGGQDNQQRQQGGQNRKQGQQGGGNGGGGNGQRQQQGQKGQKQQQQQGGGGGESSRKKKKKGTK